MKSQKGITLIALVITIIVMLILVGVTVSVSLNGGLFSTAKEATEETQIAQESEQLLVAAMGALGEDGKVDLEKLDSNLPEGFEKIGEATYKSSTGNTFTVGIDGTIALVGGSTEEETEDTVTITFKTKTENSAFKFVYLDKKDEMIYATEADSYTMKVAVGTKIEQPKYLRPNWTESIASAFPVSVESISTEEGIFYFESETSDTLIFNLSLDEIPCWSYCAVVPVFEYEDGTIVNFTELYANEDMTIFCWDDN